MEEQLVSRAAPNAGDLLVSRRSARADAYQISVVSQPVHGVARSYQEAVNTVKDLAGVLGVDAWFTCDHRHYLMVARHRPREFIDQFRDV
jgi:hypothetical protein